MTKSSLKGNIRLLSKELFPWIYNQIWAIAVFFLGKNALFTVKVIDKGLLRYLSISLAFTKYSFRLIAILIPEILPLKNHY